MEQANEISRIWTMASDMFPNLSEPLLPPAPASQQQDDDDEADCESQSPTQASTIASTSRVASSDEADAAGGIDPLLSSQSKTKMNGFVLAVILFFNASGMSLMCRLLETNYVELLIIILSSPPLPTPDRWALWNWTILKSSWKFVCNYWLCGHAYVVVFARGDHDLWTVYNVSLC